MVWCFEKSLKSCLNGCSKRCSDDCCKAGFKGFFSNDKKIHFFKFLRLGVQTVIGKELRGFHLFDHLFDEIRLFAMHNWGYWRGGQLMMVGMRYERISNDNIR